MANWWDNGLQGKSGTNDLPAVGQTGEHGAYIDLTNGSPCGSIVLREDNNYSQLLYTSAAGIQIYARIRYDMTPAQLYHPSEIRNVRYYGMQLELRRKGVSVIIDNAYNCGALVSGSSDLQNTYYRSSESDLPSTYDPSRAYPRNGSGNVQSIAVVATNAGLEFWVVGFGGYYESMNYTFEAPATKVGVLRSTYLNNPLFFDPKSDALSKADADVSGNASGFNNGKNIDYDYTSDDIDFPGLPSTDVTGLGYYKIFLPTSAQLTSAFDIFWVSGVGEWWEILSKIFYKPEQYVVSLMMFPFAPTSSGSAEIKFGMYPTGVTAATTGQWATVDCGSLTVPMKYGSVLDYSPYEQVQLFLPFIGIRSINVDQISGGTIAIKYNIDLLTGSATCFVKVNNTGCNNSVLYTFDCNMAIQVPINSTDYSQLFTSLMGMGTALAFPGKAGMAAAGSEYLANNATTMACLSGQVSQSGHLSANSGVLSGFKPYLILEHPVQSLASGYASYNGFPSNITSTLSGLSGYTVVESIHLEIPGATEEELRDIESYLHNGVVL